MFEGQHLCDVAYGAFSRSLLCSNLLLVLRVNIQRKNMPRIKSLAVWGLNVEWSYLILGEPECFAVAEVIAQE